MYQHTHPGWHGFAKHGRHDFRGHHPFMHAFRRPKYNVPVNIIDNYTSYKVHVFATGFAKEDIKITITDDLLYINGKREVAEDNKPNFSRQEFPIKHFERVIALNGKVDATAITAKHEHAVLKITLPKTAEAQTKEQVIEVL